MSEVGEVGDAGGVGGPGGGAEVGSDGPGPGGGELAALAWKVGEDVDPPVELVVDGKSYMVGAGPPEGRVEMTAAELRAVAAEIDDPDATDEERNLTD